MMKALGLAFVLGSITWLATHGHIALAIGASVVSVVLEFFLEQLR